MALGQTLDRIIDIESTPSFLRGVVETEGWRTVQLAWEGVPALAAELAVTQAPFDWDLLRLHLHKLVAQFPFPDDLLPPAAKSLLVTLIHRRLDLALETVTRARVANQRYGDTAPPPPDDDAFGPLDAMKAMEAYVVTLQKGNNLPPITKAIYARVVSDTNLAMLARLYGELSYAAKASMWSVIREWTLALSYCADDLDLCRLSLETGVSGHDPLQLLQTTIKGDPPLKVAEAATRIAERLTDAGTIPVLVNLLNGRYPNHLKVAIATALKAIGDATAAAQLTKLSLAATDDDLDNGGVPYFRVRMAAMSALATITERDPSLLDTVLPVIRQISQRESVNTMSRLHAILLLARHFNNSEGFTFASEMVIEAAARHYAEMRDLAAEALGAMGNPLAMNQLVEALQYVNRVETSLERFKPIGADRPDTLLRVLASFGMEMHWNGVALKWVKGAAMLPEANNRRADGSALLPEGNP